MTRTRRLFATFLLALLLPVQGWAAACAQICALANQAERAEMMAALDGETGSHEASDHCANSETGAGKCCNAHVFLINVAVPAIEGCAAHEQFDAAVAHWVSFISETPYHPPIAPAA